MSKPSHRPTREARKAHQAKVKAARQTLASQQGASLALPNRPSVSNTLCPYRTPAEEQAAREEAVAAQLAAYRCVLPRLLKKLAQIPDPRAPAAEEAPAQTHGRVAVWAPDVCLSDGLTPGSECGDE